MSESKYSLKKQARQTLEGKTGIKNDQQLAPQALPLRQIGIILIMLFF